MRKPSIVLIALVVAMLALPAVASATWPAGDSPDLPVRHENGPASQVSPPAPTASRVTNVTVSRGNNTLPIVLAAAALGVALTGATYVTLRLRSVTRS